jgi:hypothetical protein
VWFIGDRSGAAAQLDRLHGSLSARLDSSTVENGALLMLARGYALAGRVDRARTLIADYRRRATGTGGIDTVPLAFTEAEIALQGRNFERAMSTVRGLPTYAKCPECLSGEQGRVFDLAGAADSAIVRYGAFVDELRWSRLEEDAFLFAPALRRLGELHEARGDTNQAATYYVRFLDVYDRADNELQPQVDLVRQRLARLKPV